MSRFAASLPAPGYKEYQQQPLRVSTSRHAQGIGTDPGAVGVNIVDERVPCFLRTTTTQSIPSADALSPFSQFRTTPSRLRQITHYGPRDQTNDHSFRLAYFRKDDARARPARHRRRRLSPVVSIVVAFCMAAIPRHSGARELTSRSKARLNQKGENENRTAPIGSTSLKVQVRTTTCSDCLALATASLVSQAVPNKQVISANWTKKTVGNILVP